jgi:hypothetical protein
MNSVQKFQVQALKVWKAGLAKEEQKLKLHKDYLASSNLDPLQKRTLELLIDANENQIRIYKDLIKQATDKS